MAKRLIHTTRIRKILAGAWTSLAGVFLVFLGSHAINTILEGYRADSNTTTTIDATSIGGDCRKVVTPNDGKNHFIPTKTLAEWNGFKGAAAGLWISLNSCEYVVGKSILLDSSQSQYLSRTPGVTGNQKKWTMSLWVKSSKLAAMGGTQHLFNAYSDPNNYCWASFSSPGWYSNDDAIVFASAAGSQTHLLKTSALYRDPAAWMHVVFVIDTAQPTAADRAAIYVDGKKVTEFSTALYPAQNSDIPYMNVMGIAHKIGYLYNGGFDGYLSDIHFVDGQALDASAFGQTDSTTGKWKPAAYAGSHGANGFHLAFDDELSVGKDSASIDATHTAANHWTPNGFLLANASVTANGTWIVPAGITSLTVSAWGSGGGGGAGGSYGGGGGFSRATIAVTPGETLEMRVGAVGTNNGAGVGGGSAGNGGGYTGVFRGAPSQANALVIAGGGGGGGPVVSGVHDWGGGGGSSGQGGQSGSPGLWGTQTAWGAARGSIGSPSPGTALAGGNGGAPGGYYGWGGGWAGYYGWGGGNQWQTTGGGAGGGGSGYGTGTDVSLIMATSYLAANNSDGLYQPGYGNGGQGGIIQLSYGSGASPLVLDSPTNNFATMNPLDWGGGQFAYSKGNLKITGTVAAHQYVRSTLAFPKTGKWYWEAQTNTTASAYSVHALGIATTTGKPEDATEQSIIYINNYGQVSNQNSLMFAGGWAVNVQTVNAIYAQSAGDVLRFAFDADTNKFWIGVNNNWFRADGNFGADPSSGANPTETLPSGHEWTPITEPADAQSETFIFGAGGLGNLTYYPNAGGKFRYAPPTGFKALSTANFPPPDVPNPKLHFDAITWTGNGSYLSPLGNLATNPNPGYDVGKSLLFNSAQNQYLSRTFGVPTDGKKWTWSGWVKRAKLGAQQGIFIGMEAGNTYADITFQSTDKIRVYQQTSGADVFYSETVETFRDPSAWRHIAVVYDSAQASAADRIKFFINGTPAGLNTTTPVPLNQVTSINKNGIGHSVGTIPTNPSTYLNGYLSEVHFVDGQALSASDFGQMDATTGKWTPKAYAGTYGANGFRLNFGNASSIGEDSAPLGGSHPAANTWTANNFWNLSAKTFLVDDGSKSGNVIYSARIVGNGTVNLTAFGGAGNIGGSVFTGISSLNGLISDWQTHTVKKNGIALFTVTGGAVSNDSGSQTASQSRNADTITQNGVAVSDGDIITFHVGANSAVTQYYGYPGNAPNLAITAAGGALIAADNAITADSPTNNFAVLNPLEPSSVWVPTVGNLNQTVGGLSAGGSPGSIPVSSGKWYWEVLSNSTTNAAQFVGILRWSLPATTSVTANPGGVYYNSADGWKRVDATNTVTYWTRWDTNGVDYVVWVALDLDAGTVNFHLNGAPQGPIALPSSTKGWRPHTAFNSSVGSAVMKMNFGQLNQAGYSYYSDAGGYFKYAPPAGFKALSSKNLTEPATFDPGLVWIKNRDSGTNHVLYDTNRGATLGLSSNNTSNDTSYPNGLLSFNNGGFTLWSDSTVNTLNNKYVGWLWKAGGVPVTNTDGTIPSKVSADPVAGFSVVEYKGTGADGTVGHGLGATPKMVILKNRTDTSSWKVWHHLMKNGTTPDNNGRIHLNLTDAYGVGSGLWGTAFSSSVIPLNGPSDPANINNLGSQYVAYAFTEVPGYSKFGSYKGNASGDGPFIYTGFKPAFVLRKNITAGPSNWLMQDSRRPGDNRTWNNCGQSGNEGRNWYLSSDQSTTESDCFYGIDILSNGFKVRTPEGAHNGTNHTIIYAAFAESGMPATLTPNSAPNAPVFISATSTNPTTLSATYSDPNNGDSGWTNYRLATSAAGCLDNSSTVAWGTVGPVANGSTTVWTSPSMAAGTYYWCAQNDDGNLKSAWASMGSVTMPSISAISMEYLVVAGGGGGGYGGGGGGGFLTGTGYSVTTGNPVSLTVGNGGTGAYWNGSTWINPTKGSNSSFNTLIAEGGGWGSLGVTWTIWLGYYGGSGGSGGWAFWGEAPDGTWWTGALGQGYSGGSAAWGDSGSSYGAWGGGAWGVWESITIGGTYGYSVDWGVGRLSSISGTPTYYAGGGGANSQSESDIGYGWLGWGGSSPYWVSASGSYTFGHGSPNTGGWGGGWVDGYLMGGVPYSNGGSGIVIIRYPDTFPAAAATTGSPTVTVTGGYRIYKWTTVGTWSVTF